MISVMIEEFREWKLRFAGRCFIILALLAGGTLLAFKMHFVSFFLIIAFFYMWLGWQDGSQKWNDIKFVRVRNTKKIKASQWFGGKHLGFLAVSLIHAILLLPMFFLIVLLWGIPTSQCLCMLGIGIASGTMVLSLFILTQLIHPVFGTLFSTVIILVWLLSGYFLPYLVPINPLMLILNLSETEDIRPSLLYMVSCFAFQIIPFSVMYLVSLKTKKETH